ncbi:MAG: glycoside hydrolase family 2 protein [Eubacterium sp.]|nr:glycoside hydrolase family 2 protein [Eubacterium sp.]
MREQLQFNNGWEFTTHFDTAFLSGARAADEIVCLPHSCVEMPYHYFDESIYQMVCGYRKTLTVPKEWEGKRIILQIGAAAHYAEVYCNGELVATHGCGYTAFSADLTEALRYGEDNRIVISVDSRETLDIPPFGHVIDYMTYGGLYREVWIEILDPMFIKDAFLIPMLPKDERLIEKSEVNAHLRTELEITADRDWLNRLQEPVKIRQTMKRLYAQDEIELGCISLSKCMTRLREDLDREFRVYVTDWEAEGVRIWDVEDPVCYLVRTELISGDTVIDVVETEIGFRRTHFAADGFYLNDRKLKIVGLNRHQSYPYVGYAMPRSMQELDADILKNELGLNAVRTSHYPQSQHFIRACDRAGLLVFTEIPGWQHIGGVAWKDQAVRNVQEMITQYRNHPSVVLWGVRINESVDDEDLYLRTNSIAKLLDGTRATGGVRAHKKSQLLEDVYTYNDFVHNGTNQGCEKKSRVTPDRKKAYLVSEYNGHMYPTKMFDSEDHRREHAIRHANVLDAIAGEEDIAGGFGWCMADYNTHQDFGSGDRICYHGVMDMFRNPKPAAYVYAANGAQDPVLYVSSAMDIGEHPTGNPGRVWIFTNAEAVKMYKNDRLIKTYRPQESVYRHLKHPPIEIDDFIGDAMMEKEKFSAPQEHQVRELLNYAARFGFSDLPAQMMAKGGLLMTRYGMRFEDAYRLYSTYIGDWGGTATSYRFEAIRDGQVVKTVVREPVKEIRLKVIIDHDSLYEKETYDVAAVRISMCDQNGNVLSFYQGAVLAEVTGPVSLIGSSCVILRGGCGGTYVKTKGVSGNATLRLTFETGDVKEISFTVTCEEV